jgi:hypothetical protein
MYVEAAAPLAGPPAGFAEHRAAKAGAVSFQLFRRGYTAPVESTRTAP